MLRDLQARQAELKRMLSAATTTTGGSSAAPTPHGAPSLNMTFSEACLKESDLSGVGGAIRTLTPRSLGTGRYAVAA